MKRLSEVVEIRSGYTFRTAVDSYPRGEVEVVQAKDLSDFHLVNLPRVDFSGSVSHLLQPGEILVSARGYSKAVVYRDEGRATVASSSLFVLRPKSKDVDPAFIAMFFNSIEGIKAVLRLSSTSSVQSITKDDLGQVLIPELPPDKQRTLGGTVQAIDDYLDVLDLKRIYLDHLRSAIISKTLQEAAK